MKKLLLFSALLFALPSFGQGVRSGDQFPITTQIKNAGTISTIPFSTINVCGYPANAVPCTNKVTTYTDQTLGTACPTSIQVVLAGTNTCVATTDNLGNWGVWVNPGTYSVTVTISTGQSYGPFWFSAGGGGGGGVPGGSPSQMQFNSAGVFGGTSLTFTAATTAPACTLDNFAPCDEYLLPSTTSSCIGTVMTADPANPTFPNGSALCNGYSATAGSIYVLENTISQPVYGGGALNVTGSSKGISNFTQRSSLITTSDDPTDTATGQTFIGTDLWMSLTRPSGSITEMNGLRVETTDAAIGGPPAAETTTSFYGIRIQDMLNKGTTTAALEIDSQTPGGFAIRSLGGPSSFVGQITMPGPKLSNVTGSVQCLHADAFGNVTGTGTDCANPGIGTGTQNCLTDWATTSTLGSVCSNIAGQIPIAVNGGPPVYSSPSLVDNPAVTTTPYTIACDTATTIVDRLHQIPFQAGAAAITVPLSSASGCAGLVTTALNDNAGTLTFTRSGADVFRVLDGASALDGQTSFTLTTGQIVTLSQSATGLWTARKTVSGGGVSTFTGDGTLLCNSGSVGTVTDILCNAPAHKYFGNNTGAPGTGGYFSLVVGDLPTGIPNANLANAATTVNSQTCTLGATCTIGYGNIAAGALANGTTATTQAAKDNSTNVATTAYVDRPTGLTAGTSVTLTAPRQYFVCTGTCTVTVPVPAAGYEFCVMNDDNVATVITLAAIGSSARYENTARSAYGTAGTGTFVSGGAVGDKVCLLGRDATHYLTVSFNGTWTAN